VSEGFFVEGAVPINDLTAAGVRFDRLDPADTKPSNEIRAMTAHVKAWFYRQFRIVAEYQHVRHPS
jgi:hypothetical protein